jgi:hypothetical protein
MPSRRHAPRTRARHRTMRRSAAVLLPAVLLAAGACHNPGTVLVPAQPTAVPASNPPPTAPELQRNPPLAGDLYGVYSLRRVAGSTIPAAAPAEGGCTVQVVAGTLSLERGRFTWTETQQRSCGGTRTTVPLRASGGFSVNAATLRLDADSGSFVAGVGTFLGRGDVQIESLTGGTGTAGGGSARRYTKAPCSRAPGGASPAAWAGAGCPARGTACRGLPRSWPAPARAGQARPRRSGPPSPRAAARGPRPRRG